MGGISGLISLLCMVAVSALNIGDTAPSLDGAQWIKGAAPVFKDRITVVEFWRTSCGNCKAQIPHLTSLQEKYGDRISITALSREPLETIEEFMKANRDQMGYTVGKVTKELSDSFMSDVKGVPYAFLINREGIIVWKGHPADIDEILARTVEGSINVEEQKKIALLEKSLKEALDTNDPEIIALADRKLLLADPANQEGLVVGIRIALYNNDPAMIKDIFDKVPMTGLSGKKANSFALMLVSESNLAYRYPEAALKFSLHALKQDSRNDYIMDVYARVLYCLGDIEKAIIWEQKALELKPGEDSYQSNLDYYMTIKSIRAKGGYSAVAQSQDQRAAK
jgi:thiol-disulfide isomerase/thioredoxin